MRSRSTVIEVILLALWLGAGIVVSAVVAPAAFAVLPTRTLAGALVGRVLPVIFLSGIAVGAVVIALAKGSRVRRIAGALRGGGSAVELCGAAITRARQNSPTGGFSPVEATSTAQVQIKKAAALTHKETGGLDARLADAIIKAADEVLAGKHRDGFIVDPCQAGAGTS